MKQLCFMNHGSIHKLFELSKKHITNAQKQKVDVLRKPLHLLQQITQ